MRVHYQIPPGDQATGSKRIYLQQSGCSASTKPERVSSVVFSVTDCQVESGSDKVTVQRTDRGCAARFKILEPSSSDQYAIFVEMENGTEDKPLAVAPGMSENLQDEIDNTDISMKFVSVDDLPDSDNSQLRAIVTIHSKAIVDNSGCRSIHLSLHPTWPVDEQLEKRLEQSDTPFSFIAPRDQKLLVFDLELRIDPAGLDSPELRTRRSLTIPHPMAYQLELNVKNEKGEVTWPSLPAPFNDLLKEFHVNVTSLIRACGSQVALQTPTVHEETGDPTTYRIRLDEIPEVSSNPELLADYEVSVTPQFKGTGSASVSGAVSSTKFPRGQVGQTKVQLDELVTSRQRRVFISPGQTASCLKDAPFTVHHELKLIDEGENKVPAYLELVTLEPDPNSPVSELGRWYVLKNLQPGRRYELKATVQYVSGEKDRESAPEGFWTKDEVTVSAKEQVVSPGQRVSVDCIAVVGPADSKQKRAEWRRSDGSPLPDGGRTQLVSEATEANEWRQTISLIFDKVELGQAATYSCFVEPLVEHAVGVPVVVPKFKLMVSETELETDSKIASPGEAVQVSCSSQQADELIWLDPSGQTVPIYDAPDETATEPYATTVSATESGSGRTVVLHIPSIAYMNTGEYICRHPSAQSDRVFHLRMTEEINIKYGESSSTKSGEALKLICSAKSGQKHQQLVWYKRTYQTGDSRWIPLRKQINEDSSIQMTAKSNSASGEMETELTVINSPTTNAQFACALESNVDEAHGPIQELPHTSATVTNVVQPVLRVKKIPSDNNQEVIVLCEGYPAHSSDRLQWFFLPKGDDSTKAVPIGPAMRTEEPESVELITKLKSTFRLGESAPATWPGSTGPQLLASAGKIVARNTESAPATPEQLELVLIKPEGEDSKLDEQVQAGTVVCQYQRPKSVIVMEGSVPMFAVPVPSDNATGHDVLIQDKMAISQMIDPTVKTREIDSQIPVAVAGSGLISSGEKSSESAENFAISRSTTSYMMHLLCTACLVFWRLWF
ncbi:hypothetical protein FGIG_02369 [Fasciola gigantica]|uniref:Ig-like domain-containing protein n=1 Tax=Fasciola gigantica TaxID=46835 RepID=A0A504Y554_FASGI|nr:hypothetical protein FGIG_02369 [Fasciola gigantica]